MRSTKEKLAQMKASREKNDRAERAFIDKEVYTQSELLERKIDHYEKRLAELMARGAHRIRPDITEWYENELHRLYKKYRP